MLSYSMLYNWPRLKFWTIFMVEGVTFSDEKYDIRTNVLFPKYSVKCFQDNAMSVQVSFSLRHEDETFHLHYINFGTCWCIPTKPHQSFNISLFWSQISPLSFYLQSCLNEAVQFKTDLFTQNAKNGTACIKKCKHFFEYQHLLLFGDIWWSKF